MSKLFKLIGAFTASVFLLLSITTSVSAEKKILFSLFIKTREVLIKSKLDIFQFFFKLHPS